MDGAGNPSYDEDGNPVTEEEEYEVSILRVTLTVNPLGEIVTGKMDAEQREIYGMYEETKGPKAGDVIFFTGTYQSGTPVTHVGIYCGNGVMIHCGDPVGYASVNSSYWQSHFYGFGRIAGN